MTKIVWVLFFAAMLGMIETASAQGLNLNLNLPNRYGASMMVVEQDPYTLSTPRLGEWRAYDHCYGTATVIFGHSAHPGGDRGGRLNQDNDGTGGRCYTNPEKTRYLAVYALVNSQYGNTLFTAYGKKIPLLTLDPSGINPLRHLGIQIDEMSLSVGGELGLLYYERYYSRGAVLAPIFLPNASLTLRLNKGLEVSFMQVLLPYHIKLWGQVVDVPAAMAGNREFYSTPFFDSPTNIHRPKTAPSLFINWRF